MEAGYEEDELDRKPQIIIETRMDSDLSDHLNKCRCCFANMKKGSQKWKINKTLETKFIELSGIELKTSELYSSIVCNACMIELDEGLKIRRKLVSNQMRLYEFVEKQEKNKKFECDSDEDTISFADNPENIQTDLLKFAQDPFQFNLITEVEIKKEKLEEKCVEEVRIPNEWIPVKKEIEQSQVPKGTEKKTKQKPAYRNTVKLCTVCGASIAYESYYKHMQRHRNIYYHCDHCSYKTNQKNNLYVHMRTHQSIESKPVLQCEKCSKIFHHRKNLKAHDERVHKKIKFEEPVSCLFCGKQFNNNVSLNDHIRTYHNQNNSGKGPSKRPKNYTPKKSKEEKPEKPKSQIESIYPCEVCGKIYKTPAACKTHFEVKHAPKSPCEICGKLVGPGQAMKTHKILHADRVKCTIEGCGQYVAKGTSLKKHMLYKHNDGEPATCDICGTEYKNLFKLRHHVNRFHLRRRFPCEVPGCSKLRIESTARLVQHYRTHMDIDEVEKERLIQKALEEKRKRWGLD